MPATWQISQSCVTKGNDKWSRERVVLLRRVRTCLPIDWRTVHCHR